MINISSILESRDITLPTSLSSQRYGFSSNVWMWELDYKESWELKNWCFWTLVLEKTLENPLDCKEIQPVHPKGDQFWVFSGWTDAEAKTPAFWPPDGRNCLSLKTLMLGKIIGRRRRGRQGMRWFDGITDSVDMNLSKLQEFMKDREGWHAAAHGGAKSQTQLTEKQQQATCWSFEMWLKGLRNWILKFT